MARKLGKDKSLIRIHLDDQMDSKTLLGSYVCTDTPGEFLWKAGALTQAVQQGRWVRRMLINHMHAHTHAIESRMDIWRGICVCVCICVYVCMCVYIFIHTHIYMCVCVCIYIYYICICMYAYPRVEWRVLTTFAMGWLRLVGSIQL